MSDAIDLDNAEHRKALVSLYEWNIQFASQYFTNEQLEEMKTWIRIIKEAEELLAELEAMEEPPFGWLP